MVDDCKLLISSSAKSTIKESAQLAKELNLGLEISRLPIYKSREMSEQDVIDKLKQDIDGLNNRVTVHAMFSDVNVASQDVLLSEIAQMRVMQSFRMGKAIGADTILFHTGNKGTLHYGSQISFKKNFIAFWKDFVKEFENAGLMAVIENVFETTPQYCMDLFEGINSPNLKLALDVGHVNLYAPHTNVIDWIKLYGENLYHLHIHNNFQTNDDHSNLENGTLNFKEILPVIKDSKVNPTFVLEMFTEEDIRKSVKTFNEIMG